MTTENPTRDKVFAFAECLVAQSTDQLRIAHNEKDATTENDIEAAHFLKLDGKRIGRDLELYGFMAKIMGEGPMLTHLMSEILYGVKHLEAAYQTGSECLREWGIDIFEADKHKDWIALF